ncbi:MAG: hypothetical protein IJ874_09600 [Ruminococcus sp.]|nr:hypothetical protein [Ruminococcus sp.]
MKKELISACAVTLLLGGAISAFAYHAYNMPEPERNEDISEPATTEPTTTEQPTVPAEREVIPRQLSAAPDPETAEKADIYHLMLNSVDYYDKASGTVIYPSDSVNDVNIVRFQTSISEGDAYFNYSRCYVDEPRNITAESIEGAVLEANEDTYYNSGVYTDIDHAAKEYFTGFDTPSTLSDEDIPDAQRYYVDSEGVGHSTMRADPTKVPLASRCLFSQDFAMGYLHDFDRWEVTEITEHSGRQCYHIKGHPDEEYGEKQGVFTVEMYLDTQTGTLVWYEAEDSFGDLKNFLYTEDLRFDDEADPVSEFDGVIPENYTRKGSNND